MNGTNVPAKPLAGCTPLVIIGLVAVGVLLLAILCHGCSSSGAAIGGDHVAAIVDAWKRITADGTITPEELTYFQGVLEHELSSGGGINWLATIGSVAGTLLTSAIGLRVYHTQVISPALESATAPTAPAPKTSGP